MNNFIISIKKLFGIIITFILGLFSKKKDKEEKIPKESLEKSEDKLLRHKNKETLDTIIREDEPETKSKLKEELKEEIVEETFDNARKDLERIFYLRKCILKIEKRIEQTDNIDDLKQLKEELKDIVKKIEKIGKIYEKEKTNNTLVIDIQKIYKETTDLVKENNEKIDEKIYELEKEEDLLEEKEEIKEEEKEESKKQIKEEPQKQIDEEQKEEKLEEKQINKTEVQISEEIEIKTTSKLENVIIKEVEEVVKPKQNDSKIVVKKEKLENKEEKKITDIPKENLEKNVIEHKKQPNIKAILIAIAAIIAKTLMMTKVFRPALSLSINPKNTIANALLMNNQIRKARNMLGKKTKKLKYEQVIQKAGLNPENQLKFIMVNSLNEIKNLKGELMQYEMNEEIIHIISQLNEMESQILEKVSELEDINRNVNTATRSR